MGDHLRPSHTICTADLTSSNTSRNLVNNVYLKHTIEEAVNPFKALPDISLLVTIPSSHLKIALHKLHRLCVSFLGKFSPCKFTETQRLMFPFNPGNRSRSIYHLHPSDLETWLHLCRAALGLPEHPCAPECPQDKRV